jgi:hypothetical protein
MLEQKTNHDLGWLILFSLRSKNQTKFKVLFNCGRPISLLAAAQQQSAFVAEQRRR